MSEHIVRSFSQDLARLRNFLVEMGGLVENQLALATAALVDNDAESATRAISQDPAVDRLEREVETAVIRMLALRQPMAMDLRMIVAAMKVSSDLERIGDYAANVAKRAGVLAQFRLPYSMSGVAQMSRLVQENLKLVMDSVGENDAAKAAQVWRSDQAVDDLYNVIFRELITYMMEDPRSITPCTHLLFVIKNLERIGDHATNIAELIHYAVTGESLPEARPKGDTSGAYAVLQPRD